jgi:hypothetical protein
VRRPPRERAGRILPFLACRLASQERSGRTAPVLPGPSFCLGARRRPDHDAVGEQVLELVVMDSELAQDRL